MHVCKKCKFTNTSLQHGTKRGSRCKGQEKQLTARQINTHAIITCATKREEMQNTTYANLEIPCKGNKKTCFYCKVLQTCRGQSWQNSFSFACVFLICICCVGITSLFVEYFLIKQMFLCSAIFSSFGTMVLFFVCCSCL